MEDILAAIFSEPLGGGYTANEAPGKITDSKRLKIIRKKSQRNLKDFVRDLDSDLIEKVKRKIEYFVRQIEMKNVVISADGDRMVYSVPDVVADNLDDYCMEFCDKWLHESPHASKYRVGRGWCYNESDFIDYLNEWIFPNEKSVLVKNLGWIDFDDPLPEPFNDCPEFNF